MPSTIETIDPGRGDAGSGRPTHVRYYVAAAASTLAIITYLHRVGFQSIASDLLKDLGMNQTHSGYMTVAFMLAYGLFEVPWGRAGDRRGARHLLAVIVLGGSAATAAIAAVVFVPDVLGIQLAYMLSVRFLFGLFQAGTFPVLSRLMADWIPTSERGKAQGLIWMSSRTGGALAPIAIIPLFKSLGTWQGPPLIGACVGVAWVCAVWPWLRNKPEKSKWTSNAERQFIAAGRALRPPTPHGSAPWAAMLRSTNVWSLWLMYGCLGFSGNFFLFQYNEYLRNSRHLDTDTSKWLTVTPFACGVFACIAGGAGSDWLMKRLANRRLGRRLVGVAGLSLAGVCIALTPSVHNVWLLGVLYGLTFFGNDLSMGPAWAAASDIGQQHTGALSGAMNMASSLMAALAALMSTQSFYHAGQAALRGDTGSHDFLMGLPFYVFALVYFMGVACWLRVDASDSLP